MFKYSIINIVLTFFILFIFIYFLLKPSFVKWIINGYTDPILYDLNSNAKMNENYLLYSKPNNKNLIVVFQGGAFLTCDYRNSYGLLNTLFTELNEDYDILTFNYPVRFNNTLHDSLKYINDILKKFVKKYENYIGLGLSAGTLLLGTFIQKEINNNIATQINIEQINLQFSKFIGINGVYSTNFNNIFMTKLFQFYIMKGVSSQKFYTCLNIPIPKYIISNKYDFLYFQSYDFLKTENNNYKIYENDQLDHRFILRMNLTETQESVQNLVKFIKS